MKARIAILIAVGLAACQGEPDHQHATLGSIGYDVPVGWQRADRGARTSVWTPDDNSRKESLTVISTDLDPATAKAGGPAIAKLLIKAQASLPRAKVSPAEAVTTSQGLQGFRVAVEFEPISGKASYTRVHTVLIDGTTLVHVLYTAATPDLESPAVKLVVDTAHKES